MVDTPSNVVVSFSFFLHGCSFTFTFVFVPSIRDVSFSQVRLCNIFVTPDTKNCLQF